jgi:hypothetical protein
MDNKTDQKLRGRRKPDSGPLTKDDHIIKALVGGGGPGGIDGKRTGKENVANELRSHSEIQDRRDAKLMYEKLRRR